MKTQIRDTPACAGNTVKQQWVSDHIAEHPRMRGEYKGSSAISGMCAGTPPHARGTRVKSNIEAIITRNTPACAGKTVAQAKALRGARVHPRVRREYSSLKMVIPVRNGTPPPHAWGILEEEHLFDGETRNTPTCVGNTLDDLQ